MWLCIISGKQLEDTYWLRAALLSSRADLSGISKWGHGGRERANILPDFWLACKCNLCEFASSQASNLRTHVKRHTGDKWPLAERKRERERTSCQVSEAGPCSRACLRRRQSAKTGLPMNSPTAWIQILPQLDQAFLNGRLPSHLISTWLLSVLNCLKRHFPFHCVDIITGNLSPLLWVWDNVSMRSRLPEQTT